MEFDLKIASPWVNPAIFGTSQFTATTERTAAPCMTSLRNWFHPRLSTQLEGTQPQKCTCFRVKAKKWPVHLLGPGFIAQSTEMQTTWHWITAMSGRVGKDNWLQRKDQSGERWCHQETLWLVLLQDIFSLTWPWNILGLFSAAPDVFLVY